MLYKVLIANRGEIAVRIIRTARRLGIATVAVYSDADRSARHVALADEAVAVGPAPASESYLRIDRLIAAARSTGADSIHPGYGFLSESAPFAEGVRAAGLTYIGPSPHTMRLLGDKSAAKQLAERLEIPVVLGYSGEAQDGTTFHREAKRIGYPVLIKAAAGGGGRGMRMVAVPEELDLARDSAAREARSAFGDGRLLLEKLIERPRHVEVQVFGDGRGNVVHLYERECSLQRRHQKVIEEAPAPNIHAELRAALTGAAVKLAKEAKYEGAGTIEFLVAGGTLAAKAPWFFIEANTRLQVEHPVTEEITGLDLVEWQLRVAAGEPLPKRQKDIAVCGHAVEARLYAEDPDRDFAPSPGRLVECRFGHAQGVRIETGVGPGDEVTPYYDPMIAKLIAVAPDRMEALRRLARSLDQSTIIGPRTNAAFLKALVTHPEVTGADIDTNLIARKMPELTASSLDSQGIRCGLLHLLAREAHSTDGTPLPWQSTDAFQLGGTRSVRRAVDVDGRRIDVKFAWEGTALTISAYELDKAPQQADEARLHITSSGPFVYVLHGLRQTRLSWTAEQSMKLDATDDGGAVRAPINGRLAKVFVEQGAMIKAGERIAVVEAMKMEHVLHAPINGSVSRLVVQEGQQVAEGAMIAHIEPAAE